MKHGQKSLQNTYSQATARIRLDNLVSGKAPVLKEVGQGDPVSPKLFHCCNVRNLAEGDISHRINVDGIRLTKLRLANDLNLFDEKTKMERSYMQSECRQSESCVQNTQRKDMIDGKLYRELK